MITLSGMVTYPIVYQLMNNLFFGGHTSYPFTVDFILAWTHTIINKILFHVIRYFRIIKIYHN